MEYKVTEKDLIGLIDGFPIEVVQKMIERQVEQGNKADVILFQTHRTYGKSEGGFKWDETEEGNNFWCKVIIGENFDLFFEKYPKTKQIDNMESNKIIINGITLPKGTEAKVSVEDGTTIITFQKKESEEPNFKDGDILLLTNNDGFEYIAIFKEMDNAIIYVYTSINITNNRIGEKNGFFRDKMSNVRKADRDEQERIFKELANQKQLRWNAEELKFEEYPWRAEYGGRYWYIGDNGEIHGTKDRHSHFDEMLYNICNYFQTEELANKALPKYKDFFKNLKID